MLQSLNNLKKFDIEKMYEIYDNWPKYAQDSYKTNLIKLDVKNIDHIVFSGMGGSGTIGDVFSSIFSNTDIHTTIVKGYLLPKTVDKNTLVITTSISGNTVETLSVLKSTTKSKCKTIAFSSGGKIETFCKKNNVQFRKIPKIHSPRTSFINYLYSMLNVLEYLLPLKNSDIFESIKEIKKLQEKIKSDNTINNPSLQLGRWIKNMPILYYPAGLQAAAIRFKNSLQENAKLHSMIEDVIEASHNGVVAWEKKSDIQPILLEGKDDYEKTKERWKILKEFFNTKNIDYYEIKSGNGNILTKISRLIYLLDYSSIYKAVLDGINPSPTKPIDFIKSRI